MTDLLSIGASGARAYQSALATTSDNIANAATAGYSRRVATVREVVATGGNTSAINSGLGANVGGVTRAADAFKATEVRSASSDLARTLAGATWLGRIDSSLTQNKLGDQLTAFFTSAKAVAADPTALPARATMLENAAGVAAAFGATGKALDGAMTDLKASAETAVTQLNNLSASLAKVNAGLARANEGTAGQAALLDQRDQMLEQMSALTDVTVSFDNYGRAAVHAGGNTGPLLVEGAQAAQVSQVSNDEGAFSFAVRQSSGQVQPMSPSGGALAGIAESGGRIAAARDQISQMARDFAEGVNAVQAAGSDLQGNAGQPVFTVGDPAYQLGTVMTDPRGIAAAAAGAGQRDNSNLAGFETLRTSGKFEQGVTDLTAANGAALSGRNSVADAQSAIRDAAVSARDSVSGVNIDEEAVDLMRFQQAYQASTRVIQIARETLQSILDIRQTIMRISTSQMYGRPVSLMTQLTAEADKTQTQIATTKLGVTAVSDAAAYIKLQQIKRATTADATYKANITVAQGVVSQTDQTLEGVETQLQRALELATRAKNDTLSASDRASIGEELSSIRDTLFALANTKDDIRGQPLFGGATGDAAYVKNADGSISFAGTGEPSAIPIGDGENIQPTISGQRVFSPAGADIFATLGNLADALKAGGNVQAAGATALDGINTSLDTVALARASVGARGARLDLQADRLTDVAETREATRSGIEDTDIPTAVANLQKTLTVLQATQASFSKLTSVSLFDYIKQAPARYRCRISPGAAARPGDPFGKPKRNGEIIRPGNELTTFFR